MNFLKLFATVSVVGAALAGAAPQARAEDSSDPIRIVTNDWTSQIVLSNIVG